MFNQLLKMDYPVLEIIGYLKDEHLFFCHSRLSGILLNCSESKERFWTSQNDRIKVKRSRLNDHEVKRIT
jgi:hypothetical protein